MKDIVICGKGGVGKTTLAANIGAAMAGLGDRVLLVGCSPTADSSHLLLNGTMPMTLASLSATEKVTWTEPLISSGYLGIGCIEIGETAFGENCSSKSFAVALKKLKRVGFIADFAPDFVIYDMPGYNGCVEELLLDELGADICLLVANANFPSMYAANRHITDLTASRTKCLLALVANGSVSSFEDSFVADFAANVNVELLAAIPRSLTVRHSELYGKTVIEAGPLSTLACAYRVLAQHLRDRLSSQSSRTPKARPLEPHTLKAWAGEWGRRLGELEFGIMSDGSGI